MTSTASFCSTFAPLHCKGLLAE